MFLRILARVTIVWFFVSAPDKLKFSIPAHVSKAFQCRNCHWSQFSNGSKNCLFFSMSAFVFFFFFCMVGVMTSRLFMGWASQMVFDESIKHFHGKRNKIKQKQLIFHTEKRRNLTLVSHHRGKSQIEMRHRPTLNATKFC